MIWAEAWWRRASDPYAVISCSLTRTGTTSRVFPFSRRSSSRGTSGTSTRRRVWGSAWRRPSPGRWSTNLPVTLGQLDATIRYHELDEGAFDLGAVQVTGRYLNHPGLALGHRLEAGGVAVVYATDQSRTRAISPSWPTQHRFSRFTARTSGTWSSLPALTS